MRQHTIIKLKGLLRRLRMLEERIEPDTILVKFGKDNFNLSTCIKFLDADLKEPKYKLNNLDIVFYNKVDKELKRYGL